MTSMLHVDRTGAGLHSSPHATHPDVNGEARVTIRVDNFSHIMSAYGVGAVKAAAATVDLVLDQLRIAGCMVTAHRRGHAEISFGHRSRPEAAELLEVAVDRLSSAPIRLGDLHFHLAISCPPLSAASSPVQGHVPPSCDPVSEGRDWAGQYHRDMMIAVEVFEAFSDGRLHMGWQPVSASATPQVVLYHEALARIVRNDGEPLSPAIFVPALERLGLARAFDRQLVGLILDELEAFPGAVLGVNISGKSARLDGWWPTLFERLEQRDVARRLVVEITETAGLTAEAHAFAAALRKRGCRVALDDFGMGHASVRNAMSLCPDIVKVDAFFLRNAGLSGRGHAMLEHLVGIAGNVAPIVVIEGVETAEQSELAAGIQARLAPRSGECWQQGYHFGEPSSWCSWRHDIGAPIPRTVPLRELARPSGEFLPWPRAGDMGRH